MWEYAILGEVLLLGLACLLLVHRVPRLDLKGKTVLVTGGSAGIGLELAVQIAAKGAKVIIAARREPVLVKAVAEIAKRAGKDAKVSHVVMDVSDGASVQRALTAARQWAGGDIDVCVCNAGFSIPARFLDITQEQAKGMMDVNFFGCANVVREVIPTMYERRSGRIVLVSSMAGTAAVAGFSLYAPTKAAVRAFAQSLDMESASRGVRVQVINPPDVDTPGYEEENKSKSPECKEICAMGGAKPMRPEDFAVAAVRQIESYSFQVNVGFDGCMLAMGTAGMDPPSSSLWFLGEVLFSGLLRLVSAIYVKLHYQIVSKVHRREGLSRGAKRPAPAK